MCLGTIVSGHNRVWAQSCLGTIVSGHNRVWGQSCLGTIVSGHNRVWAQSCLGTIVSGHNHVWAQTWWNHRKYTFYYTQIAHRSGPLQSTLLKNPSVVRVWHLSPSSSGGRSKLSPRSVSPYLLSSENLRWDPFLYRPIQHSSVTVIKYATLRFF